MHPKIEALLTSKRFWVAAVGVMFTATNGLGLDVSQEELVEVLFMLGTLIVGDSAIPVDKILSSRRVLGTATGIAVALSSKFGYDFPPETIKCVLGFIAVWVFGDSIRKTELKNPPETGAPDDPDSEPGTIRIAERGKTVKAASLIVLSCLFFSGCSSLDKIPDGTQLQSSTFGLRVAPNDPAGTPLTLGSHSTIVTTAQPPDAGPNLNRFQAEAPMGVNIRSTVATGAVGEQLREAGGPEALQHLLSSPDDVFTPPPDTIIRP